MANGKLGLGEVLVLQIPFSLYHLLSSLFFVPLLTTLFLVLSEHRLKFPEPEAAGQSEEALPN